MTAQGSSSTPSSTVAAAAGRRVRDVLAGPVRTAPVLHRGQHALYLELDGWCLGLVSASASAVPCALVLPGYELGPLARAVRAEAGSGVLRLALPDERWVVVRVGRLLDPVVGGLAALPSAYAVQRMRLAATAAADELAATRPAAPVVDGRLDVDGLLGRGSGLTPLGDDVICGWAAASYAMGRPVTLPDPRERTTLFSATLIDCAQRGEVLPEFADLVDALGREEGAGIDDAATTLSMVGHTSGSGLLLGACLLFEALRHHYEGALCA